jgi:hypothetical protein
LCDVLPDVPVGELYDGADVSERETDGEVAAVRTYKGGPNICAELAAGRELRGMKHDQRSGLS